MTRFSGETLLTQDQFALFKQILAGIFQTANPPTETYLELIQKGVLVTLQADASPEALKILEQTALTSTSQELQLLAFQFLARLAENGSSPAIDSLFTLALEADLLGARQAIHTHAYQSSLPALNVLFDWVDQAASTGEPHSIDLPALTQAVIHQASPALQNRILLAAQSTSHKNWAILVNEYLHAPIQGYQSFINHFGKLGEQERQIALQLLAENASRGDLPAQSAVCSLFIEYEDLPSRQLALKCGYLPADPQHQALFYFYAERWQEYQDLDFDHRLLNDFYEQSDRPVRRRLLAFSRQTGQIEWLRDTNRSTDTRWLADLSDGDWEIAVQRLASTARYPELWRLSQSASALWASKILHILSDAAWMPEQPAEQAIYQHLVDLARPCWPKPFDIQPALTLQALTDEVTSLAFNADHTLLAAGTNDQRVYLWQLPGGELHFPALIGPAATTRALSFSPDNQHLASASGDQRIRVFNLSSGQIVKTFDGHKSLVRDIVIHPNGRMLISAGFDASIRLWRFPMGTELKRLESPVREIFCLALLSNATRLASAGAAGDICIWSLPEGHLLGKLTSAQSAIIHLAGSETNLLASAGRNRSISAWNISSGREIHSFTNLPAQVTGLCLHPNEQSLFYSDANGQVHLLNLSTGGSLTLPRFHQSPCTALHLSHDGLWLASADQSGRVCLWNLQMYLWLRQVSQAGAALPLEQINKKLKEPGLTSLDKNWLIFISECWKINQRFNIEISELGRISLNDFDIEL